MKSFEKVKEEIIERAVKYYDYMKSLPNQQQDTIKKLAQLTFTSPSVVYRWISGEIVPPMLKKRIIAEYLGKSVEELFPDKCPQ